LTPLGALQRFLDEHGEPEVGAPNFFWNMAMLDEAAARGIDTVLTGAMGNVTVSWPGDPAPVFRAAIRGHLRTATRAVVAWRAAHAMSWLRTIWHTLVRPAQAEAKRMLARVRAPRFDAGAYINPAFAQRLDLAARAREAGWIARLSTGSADALRYGVVAPGTAPGNCFYETLAGAGVEMRDPTADVRLVEFCSRVPERLFSNAFGNRWLMRRGAEGILPPEVQWNVRRAVQSADLAYRLRAESAGVEALLARVTASPRCTEYLNVAYLRETWRSVCDPNERYPSQAAFRLVPLLLVGEFLARLDD
jgi:asparagine synthase (glutamine-hydrolysing)